MILVWLILIPFVGGLLCWQADRWGDRAPRWIALATMLFVLAISLVLWVTGDFSAYCTGEVTRHWLLEWRTSPGSRVLALRFIWLWTACR